MEKLVAELADAPYRVIVEVPPSPLGLWRDLHYVADVALRGSSVHGAADNALCHSANPVCSRSGAFENVIPNPTTFFCIAQVNGS